MHSSMTSLAEVVAFDSQGGGAEGFAGTKDPLMAPLDLAANEQADLVALLVAGQIRRRAARPPARKAVILRSKFFRSEPS